MDRMLELIKQLNYYAYRYYVLDEPVVSDVQYDTLYDELKQLEKETGIILPDSPTRKVGGDPIKEFVQHEHIHRLYSLDKCNTFDELREWDAKIQKVAGKRVNYTLEYKLDGLTLCLTYDKGYLVTAATRGNGTVGEDVTAQVSTIKSIPSKIAYEGLVEAQGEGIMRWSAFRKYNETASEPLKNPRNGVAGAIRNLDPKITASRNLDVIFYNVNSKDGQPLLSQTESIAFLRENHFKTEMLWHSDSIEELIAIIENIDRQKLDFLIDGMVIKVDDFSLRERLGYTDKFPKWAIAYKFEAEETTTLLRNVIWQVGRTGKLTPLGLLEPVELCGATISKATLNNYGDILRKKVKLGSTVFIRRSNDVIPEILGVAEENEGMPIELPKTCPACGADIYEDGAHIFCPNEYGCPPQICGRIEHFCSKDCMDIEGVSEKTVLQLFEKLNVRSLLDLYSVDAADLEKIDGFKQKKTENFLHAVQHSKSADLPHFINALGIPNIGKKTARDLAAAFGSIEALMQADRDRLLAIPEVGEIMADSILAYVEKHRPLLERFRQIGIDPKYAVQADGGKLSGKKIVLTGSLSVPRSQVAACIESLGGIVQSAVTSETDFVVAGEKAGSKLDKAKKLNIKIMDENEFNSLINA